MLDAARGLSLQLHFVQAGHEQEFDAAFSALAEARAGAHFIGADAFLGSRRDQLAALALQHSLPASGGGRESAEAGYLLSYGASSPDAARLGGVYTAKILKGAKPGDLPVVLPTKFELVINLKTAKTLGLTIPPGVLAIADDVIE